MAEAFAAPFPGDEGPESARDRIAAEIARHRRELARLRAELRGEATVAMPSLRPADGSFDVAHGLAEALLEAGRDDIRRLRAEAEQEAEACVARARAEAAALVRDARLVLADALLERASSPVAAPAVAGPGDALLADADEVDATAGPDVDAVTAAGGEFWDEHDRAGGHTRRVVTWLLLPVVTAALLLTVLLLLIG